jgi:hypothetical protein
MKSDPEIINKIKNTFKALYLDKNGDPFFYKEDFADGLRIFFKEQ